MENLNKILAKLKKLKALYESAKKIESEGEAQAAAAAIQRLLTQYNLSMEEIGEESTDNNILHEETSGYTYKSIGGFWESTLTNVLCENNFCKLLLKNGSYKSMIIIGKKENVETVKWMRTFLSEIFVSLSKIRYKEFIQTEAYQMKPIVLDTYQRSYLMGCASGLAKKLREERIQQQKEQEGQKITALILKNDNAVKEYVQQKFNPKPGKTIKNSNFDAYHKGVQDGKNVQIHKQVQ